MHGRENDDEDRSPALKGGALTTKIESVFLTGTDYSPLK